MTIDPARDGDTAPAPAPEFLRLHRALASLALATGPTAALGQHTGGRHLAFLPPEALELDLADPAQRDFGDYELLEKIGQGGMGVVYRARQKSLDREVAVKLLAAGPWASRDFIERFRREAQSAARMQHPGIVSIIEVGAQDDLNFFSMELVRGESLAGLLAREGALPQRRAAALLRTIAEAVDYAHRLGVLHLDLKPGNVLMDERGEPLVADFGLARRLDETLASDSDEISGTPSYMAPEQVVLKLHKLSPATDVYGLGAILYELLSGRPPFLGATPHDTLQRVVRDVAEPLQRLAPKVSADLAAIAARCLAKDPKDRYPGARALAEDLGRYLDGRPVSVRPLGTLERFARAARREPRAAAALGAFVLALFAGLLATALQWRRADANAMDARENLWVARAHAAQAALAEGDGFRGLRPLVANLVEMEATGHDNDAALERQRIGTVLANAPRLVDLIRLQQGELVSSLAIAPDGRHFAAATISSGGERSVRQFEVASGRELWATRTDGLSTGMPFFSGSRHGQIWYAAAGTRILVRPFLQAGFAAPLASDMVALDARTGAVLAPPGPAGDRSDMVFSDDGRYALVRFRTDRSRRLPDFAQFHATDDWRALGPRIALDDALGGDEWLPMPDGSGLLGTGACCRITLFEPATLAPRWRLDLPANDPVRAWRFSDDGTLLALGTLAGAVYLVDARDGSHAVLPSARVATVRWLEFSADRATLVALSDDAMIASWDVASRRPRATPFQMVDHPEWGQVRVVGDTLYSAFDSELRYWGLAPVAPFDNAVVPGAARVRHRREIATHAYDIHTAGGLLIVGGSDGTIGLWRLPTTALLRARAAPLGSRSQWFDGERVVAVDGRSAQLLDVASEAPLSPAFVHPEAVHFAELSYDGRSLVTVAGRTVRVIDPATGTLRGAPVVLPQTPLRADLARLAPVAALTTGEYVGNAFHERIHVIDLASGQLRTDALDFPGPLLEFNLDPLGRYALASSFPPPDLRFTYALLDFAGASRRCEWVEDEANGWIADTAIADDGRTAWYYTSLGQRRGRMLRWDLDRCRAMASIDFKQIGYLATIRPEGAGVVAHRLATDALTVFDADGRRRDVAAMPLGGSMREFALSRDGRRAAQATRNAVLLVDLARGERLSAPLAAPIAGNDAIARLAFSPDATRLLARTIRGRWLVWNLPVATLEAPALARLATLLDPDAADAERSAQEIEALRRELRAADPGMPAMADAREWPRIELAAAAAATAEPRFVPLDLRAAINVPLNGAWPRSAAAGGDLVTLAPGPQRLNGIDWRVEGGVQLSRGGGPPAEIHPTLPASAEVPVPMVRARRAHVLMLSHVEILEDALPRRAARVVLIGTDGRESALEIQTVRDFSMHLQPEKGGPTARIGWVGPWVAATRAGFDGDPMAQSQVYAVSLDVPADVGAVRGLRLETADGPMEAPLFYAVTLETAPAEPAAHPTSRR